jgi:mannosyltransferase OCH1-like enzyme
MNPADLTFEQLDEHLLSQHEIIHQVWFDFGVMPSRMRSRRIYNQPLLKSCRKSWSLMNPRFFHIVWNRQQATQLIRTYYKEYEALYHRFPHDIQRCDFVRYCILHRYGGIYADMDYKCCQPFDRVFALWNRHDVYLVESPNTPGNVPCVSNSLMIARVRDHPFWKILMVQIHQSVDRFSLLTRHFEVMYTTGPGMLTRVFRVYRFRYRISGLPSEDFHPLSITKRELTAAERDRAYAIHYGMGSWESLDSKILIELWKNYGILLLCAGVLLFPQLLIRKQK